ncbi:flagellar biosynthetic protein FliO [Buchnera aphidicola]|uniref:flagellar biosynthetic protein FliO n=1 Tax=Buchnera aphidicola TaxID=9 RepID=UPI0031B703BD
MHEIMKCLSMYAVFLKEIFFEHKNFLLILILISFFSLVFFIFKKIKIFKFEKNKHVKIISKTFIDLNNYILIIEFHQIVLILGITKNNITCLHKILPEYRIYNKNLSVKGDKNVTKK